MLIVSFNIRYPSPHDGPNAWQHRCHRLAGLLQALDPDLAGLQEVTPLQRTFLEKRLTGHEFHGRGRLADGGGEQVCVAVRRGLEVQESGTFWLSEEPDRPGSVGWDAQLPRICTWVRLRELQLFNVHLDHAGDQSRLRAAELLLAALQSGNPGVLVGDLNEEPHQPAAALLRTALADALAGSRCGTYHGFGGGVDGPRIDYILLSGPLSATAGWTVYHEVDGRFPSDHHPVAARVRRA